MVAKRFRTRRYRSNLTAWTWACGLIGSVAVLVAILLGDPLIVVMALAGALLGGAVAWWRDRMPHITYSVEQGHITLGRAGASRSITREEVMDANVLDRTAARDYVRQTVRSITSDRRSARKATRELLRYCSVDIGMDSLSFGIGRSMLDRLPNGKDDLVLLRVRTGEQFLLSPVYPYELARAVGSVAPQRTEVRAEPQVLAVTHALAHPQGGA